MATITLTVCDCCKDRSKEIFKSVSYYNKVYCEDCFVKEFTKTCTCCNNEFTSQSGYFAHDGNHNIICPQCDNANFNECELCGDKVINDELHYMNNGYSICEDCIETIGRFAKENDYI